MIRLGGICLVVLFTVVSSMEGDDGYVSFSGTTVKLDCPLIGDGEEEKPVQWYNGKNEEITDSTSKYHTITNYEEKHDGLYKCTHDKTDYYYFYIKAVVCEGCVELDTALAFGVIFGDVLITLGVVIIVYMCARKNSGSAPAQRATQQQQASRPPIPPNPDYQTLNQATRANAVYSEAKRRQ